MLYRPRLGTDFKDSLAHAVEVKTLKELEEILFSPTFSLPQPQTLHFEDGGEMCDPWARYCVCIIFPDSPNPCAWGYLNDDPKNLK